MKIRHLFEQNSSDPFGEKAENNTYAEHLLATKYMHAAEKAARKLRMLTSKGVVKRIMDDSERSNMVELVQFMPGYGIKNTPENQAIIKKALKWQDQAHAAYEYLHNLPYRRDGNLGDLQHHRDYLKNLLQVIDGTVEDFVTTDMGVTQDAEGYPLLITPADRAGLPLSRDAYVLVYDSGTIKYFTRKNNLNQGIRAIKIVQGLHDEYQKYKKKYDELCQQAADHEDSSITRDQ